jgi:hypothetical protein
MGVGPTSEVSPAPQTVAPVPKKSRLTEAAEAAGVAAAKLAEPLPAGVQISEARIYKDVGMLRTELAVEQARVTRAAARQSWPRKAIVKVTNFIFRKTA